MVDEKELEYKTLWVIDNIRYPSGKRVSGRCLSSEIMHLIREAVRLSDDYERQHGAEGVYPPGRD